jgi:hypothetical protein
LTSRYVGRQRPDVDAAQLDGPLVGQLEAGDEAQGRRLAGARRAEQGEELPAPDVEVDAVDGRGGAEALDEAAQPHVGHLAGVDRRPGVGPVDRMRRACGQGPSPAANVLDRSEPGHRPRWPQVG